MQIALDSKIGQLSGKIVCKRFVLEHRIGFGAYGTVYRGIDQQTNEHVAVKIIGKYQIQEIPELEYLIPNEINSLKKIQCDNVVKYIDVEETKTNYYIVMEYCKDGDLAKKLKNVSHFSEPTALEYFCQILNAYKAMHKQNIMHRDIKLENIMFNNGILKIIDFGFAKIFNGNQIQNQMTETVLGSPIYMAPEILEGKPYGPIAEIYSLGVILYLMVFGKPPFEYKNFFLPDEKELTNQIKQGKISYKVAGVVISEGLLKLLKNMLEYNPQKRYTFKQLFEDPVIINVWAIDSIRGEGRVGLPVEFEEIKFQVEEKQQNMVNFHFSQDQMQQFERKQLDALKSPKIRIQIEQDDDQLKQSQEQQYQKAFQDAQQQEVQFIVALNFILQNYQLLENINSQLAKSIFYIQKSKICYVKNFTKALAYMMKYLILQNMKLYDGYIGGENIFNFKEFEFLKQLPAYINLRGQFERNTFPIIQDHQAYFLNETLQQLEDIEERIYLKTNFKNDIKQFEKKMKKVMFEYYKEIRQSVKEALGSKYPDEVKKQYLFLQLRVLIVAQLNQIFNNKSIINFADFENGLMESFLSVNWRIQLTTKIFNLENGQI